jgi:serine/threonine-protein kinase
LADAYPYGLSFGSLENQTPDQLDKDFVTLRGGDKTLAILRADWMVARGAQPPLYYKILFDLSLPELIERSPDGRGGANPLGMTDADLERHLGVAATANIAGGRVARAGFTHSGVSGQNRLVERHALDGKGFYWKSYDFKSSNRSAILSEFPLGPRFDGNVFQDLAFEHDGGEIIFSLPNGLQGYLLVDGAGRRIDAGPIEVVGDSLKTSGNEQIVAGVSCIACHRQGMIEAPLDEIRETTGVVGEARRAVQQLYPSADDFRALLAADSERFVEVLEEALGPVAGGLEVADLPEPVGETARRYLLEPVRLETAAAELGVASEALRLKIENDPRLAQLGMRVLLREGGTVRRAAWESPAEFPLMRQVARSLGFDNR